VKRVRVARNTIAPVPRRALLTLVALALVAGCSRGSGLDHPPGACTDGSAGARVAAIRAALAKAPGPVALSDGTRISDCLAHDAGSGDIQTVGSMMLTITQHLADDARGASPDQALTQLGYLIGAVHRGAQHAQGIDDELVRRLDQELSGVAISAPAYRAGERAGRATG
jgi:hypothetical protein